MKKIGKNKLLAFINMIVFALVVIIVSDMVADYYAYRGQIIPRWISISMLVLFVVGLRQVYSKLDAAFSKNSNNENINNGD